MQAQTEIKDRQHMTTDLATSLSVGDILRRARLSSKQSLTDVEAAIRIRAPLLEALENMDVERLPGWTYTQGFIRTYAEYLGLDGDKMQALLKTQVGKRETKELNFPVVVNDSSMPDLWVIVSAGVGLLVVIAFMLMIQHKSPSENINTIPDIASIPKIDDIEEINTAAETSVVNDIEIEDPDAQDIVPETDLGADATGVVTHDESGIILPQMRPPASARSQNVVQQDYRIIIQVRDESWVEIRDPNAQPVVSRILKPGDKFYVPDDAKGYTMTTGNIAGIKFIVDGTPLNIRGRKGDIRRNIPLEPESLKEMFP